MRAKIAEILERYPEVRLEEVQDAPCDPTFSDPDHSMLRLVQESAQGLIGHRPPGTISLGGTDCRFWRAKGVPAYVYGCSPTRMGAPNELVPIDEFLHVLKVHALASFKYLSAARR